MCVVLVLKKKRKRVQREEKSERARRVARAHARQNDRPTGWVAYTHARDTLPSLPREKLSSSTGRHFTFDLSSAWLRRGFSRTRCDERKVPSRVAGESCLPFVVCCCFFIDDRRIGKDEREREREREREKRKRESDERREPETNRG